jgi:hypothetical protein
MLPEPHMNWLGIESGPSPWVELFMSFVIFSESLLYVSSLSCWHQHHPLVAQQVLEVSDRAALCSVWIHQNSLPQSIRGARHMLSRSSASDSTHSCCYWHLTSAEVLLSKHGQLALACPELCQVSVLQTAVSVLFAVPLKPKEGQCCNFISACINLLKPSGNFTYHQV